jgi:hypothetical protein
VNFVDTFLLQVLKETEGEERSRAARAECHLECGIIYQKQRDYKRSADELLKATELDHTNAMVSMVWNRGWSC